MKKAESSSNGLKTLWEKEKLLVTSNFSFSHSAFKRLVLETRKNQGLFGKRLNISSYNKSLAVSTLYHTISGFYSLRKEVIDWLNSVLHHLQHSTSESYHGDNSHMYFLGFTSTRVGLWSIFPKDASFTLSQTIPGFYVPGIERFCKHCRNRRKCWLPAFSPFLTMFSIV